MHKLCNRYLIRISVVGWFLVHFGILSAQTYYVSSINGDDGNNGLSPATAWKTIDEVNRQILMLRPGNSVLFERGGIYYGSIKIPSTVGGSVGNPITFGAYGEGEMPILSGAKQITGWEKIGENLWKANVPERPLRLDVLFMNGKKFYPARFPNKGYRYVTDLYPGGLQDNTLKFPDGYWNGATIAFKVFKWDIFREIITYSHHDGRIDMDNPTLVPKTPGWGYFFQNHIHALDTIGEWVYDKNDYALTLCTSENPNDQRIEFMYNDYAFSMEYPIWLSSDRYIPYYFIFENLCFQHYQKYAIYGRYGKNVTIRNNLFRNGRYALFFDWFEYCDILENSIHDMEVNGIEICHVSHSRIQKNTIRRIGISLDGNKNPSTYNDDYVCVGIRIHTNGASNSFNEISLNRIDSTGYSGISTVFTDNTLIKNNVVSNTLLCLGDGGGIYLTRINSDHQPRLGNKVIDNIVFNTIGNDEGTPGTGRNTHFQDSHGIYMDEGIRYVEVVGNTVFNCGGGIYFGNTSYSRVHRNVLYNNVIANIVVYDGANIEPYFFSNNDIQYNYLYGMNIPNPVIAWPNTGIANMTYWILSVNIGFSHYLRSNKFDNNYVSAPFDSRYAMFENIFANRTEWSERTDIDLHSRSEPVPYALSGAESPEEYAILVYNPTERDTTILLNHTYISFDSIVYKGSIHLQPFKSAILFRYRDTGEPVDAPVGKTDICIGATSTYHVPESLDLTGIDTIFWQVSPPAAGAIISTSGTKGNVVTVKWLPNYQYSPVQLIYSVLMNDGVIRVSEPQTINLDQDIGRPPPAVASTEKNTFIADNPNGAEIEWNIPSGYGTLFYDSHGNKVTITWRENLVGIHSITYRLRNSCGEWGAESLPLYYSLPAAIPEGNPVLCEEVRTCYTAPPYTDMSSDFTWVLEPVNAGYLEPNRNEVCVTLNKNAGNGNVVLYYTGSNNWGIPIRSPSLILSMISLPDTPKQPVGPELGFLNHPLETYRATSTGIEYEWTVTPTYAAEIQDLKNETATISWNQEFLGEVAIAYRVKNDCGWSEMSDPLVVQVYKTDSFDDIPKIFTPNSDGFNDTWDIPAINLYPEAMIRIFNRAKKLMVEFKGAQMPWDGTDRNGNLLESGNYLYQIELRKGGKVISGYVAILR